MENNAPTRGVGLVEALRLFFTKYAQFSGRASLSEFWMACLGLMIIHLVLFVLTIVTGIGALTALVVLLSLASIVPGLAIGARRLHDHGKSGWLQLLGLIPFIGGIIVIVLMLLAQDTHDNHHGPAN